MTDPVFIHPVPEAVAVGDRLRLTGAEAKHASVKRLEAGEGVVVTDGATRAVRGLFFGDATVEVADILTLPDCHPRVTVVQAIPKSDRAELAVDLMVQAGADRIVPWAARRAIAKWDGKEAKAHAKWENAALAAAKQSRRLRVPEVTQLVRSPRQLAEVLGLTGAGRTGDGQAGDGSVADSRAGGAGATRVFVLHEEATEALPAAVIAATSSSSSTSTSTSTSAGESAGTVTRPNGATTTNHPGSAATATPSDGTATAANPSGSAATELVLVVGPEGGIGAEELAELQELGATPVRLGPEVLRTATAAAVALGAIGALTERWR